MIKILIVDDNVVLTVLLKEILETEKGYNVKTAVNGEEGYKAFLCFNPDIILTDIEMPAKNGLEMIRDIRKLNPWIKTIYMSADLNKYRASLGEEKIKYKASLLNKPFTYSTIVSFFHEYRNEGRR